jgi:hypothetical protein
MNYRELSLGTLVFIFVFFANGMVSTNVQTAEPAMTPEECPVDNDLIYGFTFSLDGEYLGAPWQPHSIRIWNAKTGARVTTLTDGRITDVEQIAFSPDNRYVITGGPAGVLMLWEIVSGKKLQTFISQKYKRGDIRSMQFSPDGQSILVTYSDGHSLWHIASGNEGAHFLSGEATGVKSAFSPDGKFILTQSSRRGDQFIRIWNTISGELLHEFAHVARQGRGSWSPDGKYILVPEGNQAILADAQTYSTVHVLSAHMDGGRFSTDGQYLLATPREREGVVGIWEVATGKRLREFDTYTGYALRPSFWNSKAVLLLEQSVETPEPQTIATIRDIATGAKLRDVFIGIPIYEMLAAGIAPDRTYAVVSSSSGLSSKLTAWDIQTGKELRQFC